MQIFKITSSWLESLNIDYSKIKQITNEETITLTSSAQIKLPTKDDFEDMRYFVRVNVSFKGDDEQDSYFDVAYVCEVKEIEKKQLSEETVKKELEHLLKEEIYPKVKNYLDEFYKISNIDFISLPSIE